MKFVPVTALRVLLSIHGSMLHVGRLVIHDRRILFEYDGGFIERGLELSPFKIPLKTGVFVNTDGIFDGLFGLFNDSLPDGWGRLLLDRQMRQHGIIPEQLSVLDRLAHVGHHGMGALCYEPDYSEEGEKSRQLDLDALSHEAQEILEGHTSSLLDELLALNESSAGARPKIMVGVSADKHHLIHGLTQLPSAVEPWLIKFSSAQDVQDCGEIEYAYSLMAKAAGVMMPETYLFSTQKGKKYFGVHRFDRRQHSERIHMHTVSGLIHADHRVPSLDYETILKVTLYLTKSVQEVEIMFRLAVFNVLTYNRDDHAKNFAFLMEPNGSWKVAPAYDLNFSSGPAGEHSTMVMGEGRRPTMTHLLQLAHKMGIARGKEIIEEVRNAVSRWQEFAELAGVSVESRERIGKVILYT